MSSVLDDSISAERVMVTAIGLYGTLAYATARRTSEIGIRMALGAQRKRVMAMVFGENALVGALGAGGGLGVHFWTPGRWRAFCTEPLRGTTGCWWGRWRR
jgi:hypothetical protein